MFSLTFYNLEKIPSADVHKDKKKLLFKYILCKLLLNYELDLWNTVSITNLAKQILVLFILIFILMCLRTYQITKFLP